MKPPVLFHEKKYFWYKLLLSLISITLIFFGAYMLLQIAYDTWCLHQMEKKMITPTQKQSAEHNGNNSVENIKKNIADYLLLKRKYEQTLLYPHRLFTWYLLLEENIRGQATIEQISITKQSISFVLAAKNMQTISELTSSITTIKGFSDLKVQSCQKGKDRAMICSVTITPVQEKS